MTSSLIGAIVEPVIYRRTRQIVAMVVAISAFSKLLWAQEPRVFDNAPPQEFCTVVLP
jgi:hypothetical protein